MAAARIRSRRRAPSALTVGLAGAALLAAGLLGVVLSGSGSARAAGVNRLTQGINSGQARVGGLAGSVRADSLRIGALGQSIATVQRRLTRIQARLYGQIAQLRQVQTEYQAAQAHLLRLERYQSYAEGVLRRQLVGAYESPAPDLMTVIIEAKGFPDLLDHLRFVRTIRQTDARLVTDVRAARRTVAAQATRLGALQVREQALTTQILGERNALARGQAALLQRRAGLVRARGVTAAELARARANVAGLRSQLARLQAQAAAAAQRAAAQTAPSSPASVATPTPSGPPVSSGGFTFPLPTSAVASPGSWSLDQGVDISAPGGTPEYAVCSGTIVLHGIGGFGPWAPVLHCDSPLDGYSYVYYGHAGPANQLPVGTHVGAGALMSEVGSGIVGISSGPHLEMGFSDASGTPIGGGSASAMDSLLRGAYGG
jgi:murein DD-endopeptidase MepM/ murein hydrolase activator NlpD